jgi:hypothetical protein
VAKQVWIPIFGNAAVADGTITHLPDKAIRARADTPAIDGTQVPPPHTILRSNIEFDQGTVAFDAKLGDPECRVQLMLPAEPTAASSPELNKGDSANTDLAAGLNVLGTPYGFAFWNGGAWEGAGGSGLGSSLPVNEWIPLKVSAKGSSIDLYADGVKVVSTTRTLKRGQIGLLLQGASKCSVRNVIVAGDVPECFVIMQFTEEFDALYKDVICPVCDSHGYKVVRGDDFYRSGLILEDVTRSIRSAALIIADVTPDNANVFYEVGFAHAIGKPTILLSDKKRERLPFDISGFRTLFYDNTIGGKGVVESRLKQYLDVLRPR